ncbi:hypothetical protein AURANDRAFT_66839 [Aureococcus anophagefferens]|uniref:Uncharacterized protein n=1 Tax=Aureococcus anophagefferens TaxID=44056 RepID=F0YJ02_AURAN|nr:hypothetical protein AURANDRAFT_66839 [Aureococcus anophagefferens]EGB04834.1 hypothetical protein AURANDRAFT_66839 [Aureococcus anophagefferens]|eukprot:XP_009040392.1 hypothetical protein AURANDRAFT_66839 [Aureococcus anophagefferens]
MARTVLALVALAALGAAVGAQVCDDMLKCDHVHSGGSRASVAANKECKKQAEKVCLAEAKQNRLDCIEACEEEFEAVREQCRIECNDVANAGTGGFFSRVFPSRVQIAGAALHPSLWCILAGAVLRLYALVLHWGALAAQIQFYAGSLMLLGAVLAGFEAAQGNPLWG